MKIKLVSVFFVFIILFFLGLYCPRDVFAANLLLNSSFEDFVGGAPTYWTKNVSTATLAISNIAKSGTQSASINKTNNSTGLIYAYQDIDIDTSSFYSLSGYVIKNDSKFSWIILRISWRDSSSEISKTDSSQLTADSTDFQQIKIDSVQPPSQAIKARIELAANIVSQNPNNPALFDDINFSQVDAPDQPTSTQTPTPTPTRTPTPTPTIKQSVSSITPSVTKTGSASAAPTNSLLDTSVLGAENEMLSPSPLPEQDKNSKMPSLFAWGKLFMLMGVVIICSACGILIYKKYRQEKELEI